TVSRRAASHLRADHTDQVLLESHPVDHREPGAVGDDLQGTAVVPPGHADVFPAPPRGHDDSTVGDPPAPRRADQDSGTPGHQLPGFPFTNHAEILTAGTDHVEL